MIKAKLFIKQKLTNVGFFSIFGLFLLFAFKSSAMQTIDLQKQNVTYKAKNTPLYKVFEQIKKQTGKTVFYSNEVVNDKTKVSIDFHNTPLNKVMDELLKMKGLGYLDYELADDLILIKRKLIQTQTDSKTENTNLAVSSMQDTVKSIAGKVVEQSSFKGINGVSVTNLRTNQNVITNTLGVFKINGKKGDNIRFTYVGMTTVILPFNILELQVVTMSSKTEQIQEVVITGYQVIDKRTFTGSVSKIKPDELATGSNSDVGKSLQGLVAGVTVENSSGTFGTKSKIRIRGNSSISGNQEPLWVVDGVVLDDPISVNPNQLYSGDAATMLSSAISGMNPDDIEDIQILKDASATAMYGTQAVNGVIVVTTKKGKAGETQINYKNNFSLAIKPSISSFNVMNSKQRMEFSEELYQKNLVDFTNLNSTYGAFGKLLFQLSRKEITWDQYYDEIQRAKTYNTDWFDVLFRNSLTQEHSISISTGNDKATYYMSGSYFRDGGQTKNQYVDRFSGNFKANFNLSNKFSLIGTLYAAMRKQRTFGIFNETEAVEGITQREYDINPYTYARTTSRAMRLFDDNGQLEFYQSNFAPFNISQEMDNNFIDIKLKEVRFQLDGLWKLRKDLNYSFIVSARTTSANSEHISTEKSNVAESYRAMQSNAIRSANNKLYNDPYDDSQFPISVLPRGGIAIIDNNQGEFYTVRNMVNYKPVFKEHSFDLMAGSELKQKQYNRYSFTGYGLEYYRGLTASPDYRAIQRDLLSAIGAPYYNMGLNTYREASFFANLAYSYKARYNLTLSTRADGSNRLGTSERFRFLPIWVIGASWNIDREKIMNEVKWLDFLKLRASYGTRGNVGGLGSPELLAFYGTTTRFNPNNVENIITITAPDNPTMRWEKEKMSNIALEFGLFSKVSVTAEWYHRFNYDLIGSVDVSRVTGFNTKVMNWADMKNEGLELTINTQNIKSKNLKWHTVLTWGYNKNKVMRLQTTNTVMSQTVDKGAAKQGYPVTGLYSFRFATLDTDGLPLFYTASGALSNSFSKYSNNLRMLVYEGSREPLGSGGLTNQFQYKNFSLSFLFTYSYGNKIRLNPIMQRYYSDVAALDAALVNRWTTPGDEKYTNIPRIIEEETRTALLQVNADPFTAYNRSNIRVADGSFVRFKNLMLAYELPKSLSKRIGVSSFKITGQAQNLVLWADPNLRGQDPEAIVSGVSIPVPTNYTLGVNLSF